jgi:hypothetical protein
MPHDKVLLEAPWGVGPGQNAKTGRRPLLGPPARLARALSQKIGGPSMHTPGHPRGERWLGTKKPGGTFTASR